MADNMLETHRTYIIELYRSGLPEETIADQLDLVGVNTTYTRYMPYLIEPKTDRIVVAITKFMSP